MSGWVSSYGKNIAALKHVNGDIHKKGKGGGGGGDKEIQLVFLVHNKMVRIH